jgi:hypothetical protein
VLLLLAALLALGTVGCGDAPVTKEQFVAQMRRVTAGSDRASPELAGCIYDRIAGDRTLLEDASSGADLAKAEERRLEQITKDCWSHLHPDVTSKRRPSR